MKNGLIVDEQGSKRYYLNDKLHREDGPAIVLWDGSKTWCIHNKIHREDGPAEEIWDGTKTWWVNNEIHRVDGPAIEWWDGNGVWYLHGNPVKQPTEFETMEFFIQHLNDNEEYSLQWINDINGIIGFIKNPTGKQKRLHAMRWKI